MNNIDRLKQNLHEFTNSFDFSSNKLEEALRYVPIQKEVLGLDNKLNTYVMNISTENLTLTRARKNRNQGDLFENIEEINYPDTKYITQHGRANTFYEARFYCSDIPGTSLLEVRPNCEWITTMDIKISKPKLKLLAIGVNSKYTNSGEHFFTDEDAAFNQFLAEKFVENIPDDKNYLYLPTAILTNLLTQELDGIVYPSFASKLKGENFAIKTDIIDKYADIVDLRVHESYDHTDNGDFKIKCLYRANNLKPNGKINWNSVKCNGHTIDETIFHRKES